MDLLFEFSLRITLIAAVTGAVLWAMRIKNAAVKHAAWIAVIGVMLLLPAWIVWGPRANLPVLPAPPATIATIDSVPVALSDTSEPMPMLDQTLPSRQSKALRWTWTEAAVGVYLFGAFILLLRLAIGTIRASRLTGAACAAPVAVGLLRPRIILPDAASEWTSVQLDAALAHERAHVRRRDPLFQWLALLNRALFWFHPLAWWLERRLAAFAEEACDAAVLEQGLDPREYSVCLLDMARAVDRAGARVNAVAMAMPGSYLPQRVRKIIGGALAPRVSRTRLTAAAIACAIPTVLFAGGSLDRAPQLLLMAPFPMKSVPQPPVLLAQAAEPPKTTPAKAESGAPPQGDLKFEVASVRASGPVPRGTPLTGGPPRGGPGTSDPERLTYERAFFQRLLMDAYGVQRDQIKGPDWATSDAVSVGATFDISAKIPPGATKEQVATMLQNLLKERFHLQLHHEKSEFSGYALAVAKGGPKIKESVGPVGESERNAAERGPVNLQTGKDGFPELFPGRNMGGTFKDGEVRMRARDYPLYDFAQQISFALAARIVDKTALTGKYDFTLQFTPSENGFLVGILATLPLAPGQEAPLRAEGPNLGQIDSVPIVSSAMEKQLGLKLETTKTAVDTLVIDHVDKTPVEN